MRNDRGWTARPPRLAAWIGGALLMVLATAPLEAQRPEERGAEAPRRGWLGISWNADAGEPGERGEVLVIERVFPGSPAERAGVQAGDTVVQWNGSPAARAALDARLQPGDTVRLRVRRAGERDRELVAVAGARPARMARGPRPMPRARSLEILRPDGAAERVVIVDGDTVMRLNVDSIAVFADSMHRHLRTLLRDSLGPHLREMEREFPRLQRELRELEREMPRLFGPGGLAFDLGARAVAGAEFAEVNEGLSDYFGTEHGALVLRVAPGSPAERAGLQAGDVVVEAGGRTVESVRDLRRAVQAARQDRDVEVEVVRKGRRQELRMRWEE